MSGWGRAALLAALVVGGCHRDGDSAATKRDPSAANETAGTAEPEAPSASEAPAQIIIDDVAVRVSAGPFSGAVDSQELAHRLGRQLVTSGFFFALPNQADPLRPARRAHLDVTLSVDRIPQGSAGTPALLAAVEATVTWTDDSEPLLRENLVGELTVSGKAKSDLPRIVRAHVEETVDEVGARLIDQEQLRTGPDHNLVALLKDPDARPGRVRFALGELPHRHIAGATALAGRHLHDDAEEVRDAAFTAIVALGDPAGVDALTRAAQFADHDAMRATIEAVTALGGPEAVSYLEFVASGHPDEDIQDRAREGLQRLQKRAAAASDQGAAGSRP